MPDKSLTPRKAPRQNRSRERVDKIMAAAQDLLLRKGLGAVTTSQVAKQAGIPVGSVYQYFPNRDAILMALGQRIVDEEDAAIETALEASQGNGSLESVVDSVLDAFGQMAFRIEERTEFDHALARFPEWLESRRRSGARIATAIANHPEAKKHIHKLSDRERAARVIVSMTLSIMQLARDAGGSGESAMWLKEAKRAVLGYMSTYKT